MKEELSKKLKHLIYLSAKNRKEIYEELQISQPTFLSKVNDPFKFKLSELIALLKILNVSICDFFNAHLMLMHNENKKY